MPSGYTHKLYAGEDQSPRDFILGCARAFGATIMQRDDDPNDPPKLREHNNHCAEMAEDFRARLVEAQDWTDDEADSAAAASYAEALAAWQESQAKSRARRARYQHMLDEIAKWTPPTLDHIALKEFMVKQLRESIDFDCDDRLGAPARLTGQEFKAKRIELLARMTESYEKYAREETERVNGANAWITALYQSLDSTEVPF